MILDVNLQQKLDASLVSIIKPGTAVTCATKPKTRKGVGHTKWARQFKLEDPDNYKEAIAIAKRPEVLVDVFPTVDEDTNEKIWVIVADVGFWMETCLTQEAAWDVCKKMGWTRMAELQCSRVSAEQPAYKNTNSSAMKTPAWIRATPVKSQHGLR